jgi:prepilin-type processing-associated H-X9-DG protein
MSRILQRVLESVCIAGLAAVLAMLMMDEYAGFRTGRRNYCMSRMRNVSLALQTYATEHNGQLPPAYIADENGHPMHSWRVLLLPYLGDDERALYDQYNFDEPWDGPNNSKLADEIPEVYRCPEDDDPHTCTSCVAIVGPHTLWPGIEPRALDRVPDGATNALLLVEVHNSGIHWMEPRDLHVGQMAMTVNPEAGQGISSPHADSANVMFADGHGGPLSDDIKPELLRQLIDIDDGEPESKERP